MISMTPEEARTLLDRLQQAGNVDDPVYAEASDAIIPMLETIAGMTWEYGISNGAEGIWCPTQNDAEDMHGIYACQGIDVRLVRRLVSQPEEVKP